MFDIEKYDKVFCEAFQAEPSELSSNPKYGELKGWDSIGHVNFIVALEDAFDVEFEPEEYMDVISYNSGKDVLQKKLNAK